MGTAGHREERSCFRGKLRQRMQAQSVAGWCFIERALLLVVARVRRTVHAKVLRSQDVPTFWAAPVRAGTFELARLLITSSLEVTLEI